MNRLRIVLGISLTVILALAVTEYSFAGVTRAKSPFVRCAIAYDRAMASPADVSAQVHHQVAVSLAAVGAQVTDPREIASALGALEALEDYVPQSDTDFVWNGLTWVPDSRTTHTYSSTKPLEDITQDYDADGMVWNNDSRTIYTYDGQGRLISIKSDTAGGSGWVEATLATFTYDGGSNNAIYYLLQNWNGSSYDNAFDMTSTYSGSLPATQTTRMWVSGAWSNFQKHVYTYSGANLIEDLIQAPAGPTWADAERGTYTYDGSNRRIEELWERWGTSGPWTNWTMLENTYDGATTNKTLEVYSNWNGGGWDQTRADTSRYDGQGNRTEWVLYYVQFGGLLYRTHYTYDVLGNLIEDVYSSGIGGFWTNSARTVYVYTIAGIFDDEATPGLPAEFEIAQNYPNPFNLSTIIPYSLSHDGRVTITVTNILGQTTRTLVDSYQTGGSHTVTWNGLDANGREVSSGIYFFRVQVDGAAQVRKMVLLK